MRLDDYCCGAGLGADGYASRFGAAALYGFDLYPQPVAGDSIPAGGRTCRDAEHAAQVMGVQRALEWDSLKEGFPPAYTAHVAESLAAALGLVEQQAAAS